MGFKEEMFKAYEKSMTGGDPTAKLTDDQKKSVEALTSDMCDVVAKFITKQTIRTTKFNVPTKTNSIKTSADIKITAKLSTLMSWWGILYDFMKSMLESIASFGVIIPDTAPFTGLGFGGYELFTAKPIIQPVLDVLNKLEGKIKQQMKPLMADAGAMPALNIQDGEQGGTLEVDAHTDMSESSTGSSPTELSLETESVIFKDEINMDYS